MHLQGCEPQQIYKGTSLLHPNKFFFLTQNFGDGQAIFFKTSFITYISNRVNKQQATGNQLIIKYLCLCCIRKLEP